MTLARDLHRAGVKWNIEMIDEDVPSERYPGKINKRASRCVTVSVPDKHGDMVTHSRLFDQHGDQSIDFMLSKVLQEHFPTHPAYLSWRNGEGYSPVRLSPGFERDANYRIHVALRKSVGGPLALIQWHAFNQMAAEDRRTVIERAVRSIHRAADTAYMEAGPGIGLTRRDVGEALRNAFVHYVEKDLFDEAVDRKRTPEQEFALICLLQSCKETAMEDWVHGWTSYVCEPLPFERNAHGQWVGKAEAEKAPQEQAAEPAGVGGDVAVERSREAAPRG